MSTSAISLDRVHPTTWFKRQSLFLTVLLVFLGCLRVWPIYLVPVSRLQSESSGDAAYGFASWIPAFNEPGIAKAFLNTSIVTGLVQTSTIPVALVIAWIIARTDMPG